MVQELSASSTAHFYELMGKPAKFNRPEEECMPNGFFKLFLACKIIYSVLQCSDLLK